MASQGLMGLGLLGPRPIWPSSQGLGTSGLLGRVSHEPLRASRDPPRGLGAIGHLAKHPTTGS
eukprot:7906126-Pyramimonas_sp.AAC.1